MESLKNDKYWHYLRLLLLTFSVVLTVGSMFMIGFGAEMYYTMADSKSFIDHNYMFLIIAFLVNGLVFFVSTTTCYVGAKNYKILVLGMGAFLLTLVLILNIIILIKVILLKADTAKDVGNQMLKLVLEYGNDKTITRTWDATHEKFFCCGAAAANDWKTLQNKFDGKVIKYNQTTIMVPQSCCINYDCDQGGDYLIGCIQPITDYITKCCVIITCLPIAAVVLQVISIVLAAILAIRLKRLNTNEDVQPLIAY